LIIVHRGNTENTETIVFPFAVERKAKGYRKLLLHRRIKINMTPENLKKKLDIRF
jgi:hypothetical protein